MWGLGDKKCVERGKSQRGKSQAEADFTPLL